MIEDECFVSTCVVCRKVHRISKGEKLEAREKEQDARAQLREQHSWKAVAAQAHILAASQWSRKVASIESVKDNSTLVIMNKT